MAITIPELDNLVRAFYEGRGEQVRAPLMSSTRRAWSVLTPLVNSKSKPKRLSIRYAKAPSL